MPEPEQGDGAMEMAVTPTNSELSADERTGNGDVIALGVISGASVAGGIAYLIAASNTRDDLDAVEGTSLFDRSEERRLDQQESSQSLLGYTLLGIGVATAGGFTYVLLSRRRENADSSVAVTPVVTRRFQGFSLAAEF